MSKMDGLRAMREARYAAAAARTATPGKAAPKKAVPKAAPKEAAKAAAEPVADAETDEALCGHRNISGRTCTRERGHSAKSHRYS